MNRSTQVTITTVLLVLTFYIFIGCKKSEDTGSATPEANFVAASEKMPRSKTENTSLTLDTVSLPVKEVQVEIESAINVSLKDTKFDEALSKGWDKTKFMSYDDNGRQILGGLRDDSTRYRFEGNIAGTVKRSDTKAIIATYDFQVTKIIAGKTEAFDDAYLLCKGTYWVPFPVPKPDLPWDSVPPTLISFDIPKSKIGGLLSTEKPFPDADSLGSSISNGDLQFVLTANFQPVLFGKGSRHVLATQVSLPKSVTTTPTIPTQPDTKITQSLPAVTELEKLIADACLADRPSLQGYTGIVKIKSTTPDTPSKGKYVVRADVTFVYAGTALHLGYIDHFILSQNERNEWIVDIVKTR